MPIEGQEHDFNLDGTLKTQNEITDLRADIEQNKLLWGPFVEIGKNSIPVYPYSSLRWKMDDKGKLHDKPTISPEEYFDYLSKLVSTPEDVFKLVNDPIVNWEPDDAVGNRLFPGYVTLSRGGGDCDNISWAAKELMDALGARTGVDYQAQVVSFTEVHHAALMYTTESGDLASIDQWEHKIGLEDIYEASDFFGKLRGTKAVPYNVAPLGLKGKVRYSINPETQEKDYKRMQMNWYVHFDESFDPDEHLPSEWTTYERLDIIFMGVREANQPVVYQYSKGVLTQRDLPDRREVFDSKYGRIKERVFLDQQNPVDKETYYTYSDNPILMQRRYKPGHEKVLELYDNKGTLVQVDFRDGSRKVYSQETGLLKQSIYPDGGPILADFYSEDGKTLIQRDYRDGSHDVFSGETGLLKAHHYPEGHEIVVDFYWENGQMLKQRDFSEKSHSQFKHIFCDETGEPVSGIDWKNVERRLDR